MAAVAADDVKLALVPVAEKSDFVYQSVNMLYKCIFKSAVGSNVISRPPCQGISWKGGKPQKEREALTDEQRKQKYHEAGDRFARSVSPAFLRCTAFPYCS